MAFEPKFGTFNLTNANNVRVGSVTDLGTNRVATTGTLGAGSAVTSVRQLGRQIKSVITVNASTSSDLESSLDDVLEALNTTEAKALRFTTNRYITAYASIGAIKLQSGTSGKLAVFDCTFTATEPVWRSATQSSGSLADNSGSSNTGNIVVAGSAPTLPDWTIANSSGSNVSGTGALTNNTTDEEFRLRTMVIANGDTLNINGATGEVYFNSGANAASQTPKRIDGAFWELQVGTNSVTYEWTWTASNNIPATASYYTNYQHLGDWG